MNLRLFLFGIALAAVLPSVKAQSFLEVVSGSAAGATTSATQVVGAGTGYTVGKLRLTLAPDQRAVITYTFEGAESALNEQFFGPGGASMIGSLASMGTLLTTRVGAGLLDYSFQSAGAAATTNAANYAWNDANIGVVLASDRLSGRLLFEDGRGRLGSDHDYNDMVVGFKVSVLPVPEASSLAMLLAGLLVIGVWRRHRHTANAPRFMTPV